MPTGIPVLLYHRVGFATDSFTVTRPRFLAQLREIEACGRTPLTVSELADGLRGRRVLPPAPVCLTFDDGYADTRATIDAVAEHGLKATVYLTTGRIGTDGSISAREVSELSQAGPIVELGPHTVTHPYLDELGRARARLEIERSLEALARLTGVAPRSFAYPHGAYNMSVRQLVVDAGFESAVAVKNALSHVNDDPWAIARFTIRTDTPLCQLEAILEGCSGRLAWHGERLRTRAYRLFRKTRRIARDSCERSACEGAGVALEPPGAAFERAAATLERTDATPGRTDATPERTDATPERTDATPERTDATLERPDAEIVDSRIDIRTVSAPVAVAQLDLGAPERSVRIGVPPDGGAYSAVALLLRDGVRPAAWTMLPAPASGVLTLADIPPATARAIAARVRPLPSVRSISELPPVSVVITTCADADASILCVQSVLASTVPAAEVIVVDNRPGSGAVRDALSGLDTDTALRYVPEPRPGLACARRAGAAVADGEIVAFTDDDVRVDPGWIGALASAFTSDPDLGCVTGLILPLELESEGQLEFERFAALNKGLWPRVFSAASPPPDMPLFPYTAGAFGSGANCAFRRELLDSIGGFDPLLGAGTRTRGGEDLDIFIRLLRSGSKLLYEPGAIIWHRHPSDRDGVDSRTFDYGVGLGAVIGKLLLTPETRAQVATLMPRGLAYWLSPDSRRNAARTGRLRSPATTARETLGVLAGSLLYAQSKLRAQEPMRSATPARRKLPSKQQRCHQSRL